MKNRRQSPRSVLVPAFLLSLGLMVGSALAAPLVILPGTQAAGGGWSSFWWSIAEANVWAPTN